ncbi:DUF397 domain-containing protein [Streptomyces sp. t39]|uniref:DUF397 domain-containing protein n=1 Tax=Streptomyces sp. t39 TaxID=1828156 RepID=UPI0011CDCAD9|nr:DUF397 domain-containing protein [Streptomyces sp. t39]TXS35318.1 DUF397 domain-containing protein [Streptomyces sp. t39]
MTDSGAGDLRWFKSSHSSSEPDSSCVEVATTPDTVHVRDSKDTSLPALALGRSAWAVFVECAGE